MIVLALKETTDLLVESFASIFVGEKALKETVFLKIKWQNKEMNSF